MLEKRLQTVKRLMMFIMVLSLAFILAACGNDKTKEDQPSDEPAGQEVNFADEEKVNEDEVVANINGVEVKGSAYNLIYVQTKIQMQRFEQDIDDLDAVKEMAVNALINQEILRQDAADVGINVSEDEVTAELEDIKSENEEEFLTFLERYHLTEAAFKDQLNFAIMHDKYITSEISTDEVTDQEIQDIYGQLKANNPEVPKLEDIESKLKEELKTQKQQENLQEKLEELKETATIEKLI